MMATFNSPCQRLAQWWLAAGLLVFINTGTAFAGSPANARFADYTRTQYVEARAKFDSDADNPTNAAHLGCACYDAANYATNSAERASLAREGIAACRQSIVRNPAYAPTHYYLAMDLGQLADTEIWSALTLVREMEREFKMAASLDPLFDYAGPERNLGLLYLEAPRIGSIGSRRKAREFLESAVKLAPDYPENLLNLLEAYLKWDEPDRASEQMQLLDAGWSAAQNRFTGQAWAESWDDWSTRRDACQKALDKLLLKKTGK